MIINFLFICNVFDQIKIQAYAVIRKYQGHFLDIELFLTFFFYIKSYLFHQKTSINIVYHFNYNAICHKTAIRLICHITSESMRYIFFIWTKKIRSFIFGFLRSSCSILSSQISIKHSRNIDNLIILPVSFTKSLKVHPVRFWWL